MNDPDHAGVHRPTPVRRPPSTAISRPSSLALVGCSTNDRGYVGIEYRRCSPGRVAARSHTAREPLYKAQGLQERNIMQQAKIVQSFGHHPAHIAVHLGEHLVRVCDHATRPRTRTPLGDRPPSRPQCDEGTDPDVVPWWVDPACRYRLMSAVRASRMPWPCEWYEREVDLYREATLRSR
jgi:hypothetical protein